MNDDRNIKPSDITKNLRTNRSFLYGDGFFETLLLQGGSCHKFDLHFKRILHNCGQLQMELDKVFDQRYFEERMKREGAQYAGSDIKVRIVFYRKASGTYLPESDKADFQIIYEPYIPLAKPVLTAGVYDKLRKPCNFLSSIKTTSALMFVMAAKYAKQKGWDEVIILNEHHRVCEALTSNVFLKINEVFYTPPLSEGCIDGVNRKYMLAQNKAIVERPIEMEELKQGELYFSNAVRGLVQAKFIWEDIK